MSQPIKPMRDDERVLGQIARGEVRTGPDAAREIAARHQAAYGNTVWGPASTPTPAPQTRKDGRS